MGHHLVRMSENGEVWEWDTSWLGGLGMGHQLVRMGHQLVRWSGNGTPAGEVWGVGHQLVRP